MRLYRIAALEPAHIDSLHLDVLPTCHLDHLSASGLPFLTIDPRHAALTLGAPNGDDEAVKIFKSDVVAVDDGLARVLRTLFDDRGILAELAIFRRGVPQLDVAVFVGALRAQVVAHLGLEVGRGNGNLVDVELAGHFGAQL